MKISFALTTILFSMYLVSCSETEKRDETGIKAETSLAGRWQLQKAEKTPSKEKGIAYQDQPTSVILKLEKNGYFLLYDTFIDPNWKKKGLPLISERSKGQWEQKKEKLILNHHTKDTSFSEELELTQVDNQTLVTRGKDKKSNVYKTYGR